MSRYTPKALAARAKASLEPHLHLKVPQQVGLYDSRWSNKGEPQLLPQ